ncbi:unnamed protein product, partial [Durusdinium trenchii]
AKPELAPTDEYSAKVVRLMKAKLMRMQLGHSERARVKDAMVIPKQRYFQVPEQTPEPVDPVKKRELPAQKKREREEAKGIPKNSKKKKNGKGKGTGKRAAPDGPMYHAKKAFIDQLRSKNPKLTYHGAQAVWMKSAERQ